MSWVNGRPTWPVAARPGARPRAALRDLGRAGSDDCLLKGLKPGQRIKITQTVRVGRKSWPAVVTGIFRALNYLVTGLATDRVPEDDIVVITVHFTKDNGELSSVTLDEHTKVEIVSAASAASQTCRRGDGQSRESHVRRPTSPVRPPRSSP